MKRNSVAELSNHITAIAMSATEQCPYMVSRFLLLKRQCSSDFVVVGRGRDGSVMGGRRVMDWSLRN